MLNETDEQILEHCYSRIRKSPFFGLEMSSLLTRYQALSVVSRYFHWFKKVGIK